MLDFVWWERDERGIKRAIMGAEIEWAGWCRAEERVDEVIRDFKKLLSFKAPTKLMMFECLNPANRLSVYSAICDCLESFGQHVVGEYYLFVEFSKDKSHEKQDGCSYWCEGRVYTVELDGSVSDVYTKIKPISLSHAVKSKTAS